MEGTTILGFVLLLVLLVTIIALVSKVISAQVDASDSASASHVSHTKTYLVPSWTATGELRGGSKRVTDASGTTFTSWLFW